MSNTTLCSIACTILALRIALRMHSPNENGPDAFTAFFFYQLEKLF